MKPITVKSSRAAIEDLQRRLAALGRTLQVDGVMGAATLEALHDFQEAEGLPVCDQVNEKCWSTLVDAGFSLGDRVLYLRYPYFHGNDVRVLQQALNCLGFIAGKADGIFGPGTERALREFQANVGIDPDGLAGAQSIQAIQRLSHAWKGKDSSVHSKAKPGYARAASALESAPLRLAGADDICKQIAARVVNLALATNPDATARLCECEGLPCSDVLCFKIVPESSQRVRGVPFVVFDQSEFLAARLDTASDSAREAAAKAPYVAVGIPDSCFANPASPTPKELQHVAVCLLDALCCWLDA